jgi:GIY-YIG catalytic domain
MSILAYSPKLELAESFAATYSIYILKNPLNNEVFYVGKTTKELKVRLSGHLSDSGTDGLKGQYLKTIIDNKEKPIIEAVETIYGICYVDKLKASEREYYWIRHFKNNGSPLTNVQGMEENAACVEYKEYLDCIKNKKTSWHYYYCGKTKYGIKVYDEERLNEDGFVLPNETHEMLPTDSETTKYQSLITYEKIYDDENPNYIVQSFEET